MNYHVKLYSYKPKEDINEIVEGMGFANIAPECHKSTGFAHFMLKLAVLFIALWKLKRGDTLFLQYPYKKFFVPTCIVAHMKGAKVVTLIHDLRCFRKKKMTVKTEIKQLNQSDRIIVHNESMKHFLEQNGCKSSLTCLEIFDYLSSATPATYETPHNPYTVVYAGGLGPGRNPFLYSLDEHIHQWKLELYGKGFDNERATNWQHIHFNGMFTPDELLSVTEGDFGLVWDGNSMNGCSGNWGEYLKFNNPHKTSFYLRCGIPVIIWKKAALAPFIEREKCGLTINNLDEIDEKLASLSHEQYKEMKQKATEISARLASGYYTKKAVCWEKE